MTLYAFQICPCVAKSDVNIFREVDINATFISACLADSMQIHKMTDATNINQTDDN